MTLPHFQEKNGFLNGKSKAFEYSRLDSWSDVQSRLGPNLLFGFVFKHQVTNSTKYFSLEKYGFLICNVTPKNCTNHKKLILRQNSKEDTYRDIECVFLQTGRSYA